MGRRRAANHRLPWDRSPSQPAESNRRGRDQRGGRSTPFAGGPGRATPEKGRATPENGPPANGSGAADSGAAAAQNPHRLSARPGGIPCAAAARLGAAGRGGRKVDRGGQEKRDGAAADIGTASTSASPAMRPQREWRTAAASPARSPARCPAPARSRRSPTPAGQSPDIAASAAGLAAPSPLPGEPQAAVGSVPRDMIAELAAVLTGPAAAVPRPSVRDKPTRELEEELRQAMGGASMDDLLGGPRTDEPPLELDSVLGGQVIAIRRDDVFVELPGRQQGVVSLRQFNVPPQVGTPLQVRRPAAEPGGRAVRADASEPGRPSQRLVRPGGRGIHQRPRHRPQRRRAGVRGQPHPRLYSHQPNLALAGRRPRPFSLSSGSPA